MKEGFVSLDIQKSFEYFCRIGNLSMVKHFVSLGVNVRALDYYAFSYACMNGYLEVVKYLCSLGANMHAKDDWALRWASANGHLEVVKYLENCINNPKHVLING